MRKILILLLACLMLSSSICLAADDNQPIITAKNKKFDIFAATYVLSGDVYIAHKSCTVKADYAEYNLLKQEVRAKGNIVFVDGDFSASCQSLTAYISEENVDLSDSVHFHRDKLNITSNTANFNWQSKLAVFKENVKINNNGKKINVDQATYSVKSEELKF